MDTKKSKPTMISISSLAAIRSKQRLLFDGYISRSILSMDVLSVVPGDLINLCFRFYELNIITLLSSHYKIPTEKESTNTLDPGTIHKLAGSLYDSSEFHVAFLLLSLLMDHSDPDRVPKYHNLMGMVLQDWGSSSRLSEHQFEIAIELKPQSHVYRWNFGILLIEEEKYKMALTQFMAAAALDDSEAEYFKKIAFCQQQLGEHAESRRNYMKCIELRGDTESKYYLIFARYLHEEVGGVGALEESEWNYRRAIEIETKKLKQTEEPKKKNRCISVLSDYYIEFGELLKKMGKFKEIESVYRMGIELEKERGDGDDHQIAKFYYLFARFFRDDDRDYLRSEMYYKKCLEIDGRYDGANGSYGVSLCGLCAVNLYSFSL